MKIDDGMGEGAERIGTEERNGTERNGGPFRRFGTERNGAPFGTERNGTEGSQKWVGTERNGRTAATLIFNVFI